MSRKKKTDKTGIPPGTLVYKGAEQDNNLPVRLTLIQYNETEFIEKEFTEVNDCMKHIVPGMVHWINVDGVHKVEVIDALGKLFNIHPLTLEDVVNTEQRPKFEDYDTYVVAILKMIYLDENVNAEQLSIILKENMVISFQEMLGGDAFDIIRNRIRQGKGRVRKCGADYLAYALLDAVVDTYFVILEKMSDRIEVLEEELVNEPDQQTLKMLHSLKRQMIFLRKAVWPMRELLNTMERSETHLITPATDIYLRDLYDHTIRAIDTVETQRDLLSGMMDIYLSSISVKMNEVMKVLTIISTIFIPVTFIAGVYGMNFHVGMWELDEPYGYAITWAVMLAVMISLVIYFKKKKWL
jgi:magnesium transporter